MNKQYPVILFDDKKIEKYLDMKEILSIVEEGFKRKGLGLVDLPPKIGPKLGNINAFADSMTASIFSKSKKLEAYGLKWISFFSENFKENIPPLNGTIIINNSQNGLTSGILNSNLITGYRTGAISAVCAKYLAPKKEKIKVGIFGLGLQAYTHVLAFKALYQNKVDFLLFEHDRKFLLNFLKKFPKDKFLVFNNSSNLVKLSDVILTLTTFPKKISPYVYAEDLKEDVLILPVDYGSRIDAKLYKSLDEIYTDDIKQYEYKKKASPYFPKNAPKIKTEMGDLVKTNYKRGKNKKRILVFNLGIALFDVLVGNAVVKKIKKLK